MKRTLPTILALALVVSGVWGYTQYQEKREYRTFLNNQFHRMYYDLTGSVESITSDISKLMVSNQTKENVVLYSNIWQNAYNAQEKLSQLPIRHGEISKTEKFLSQVGDYTFTLAKRSIEGHQLTDEEIDRLEKLHNYALDLTTDLHDIQEDVLTGLVMPGELRKEGGRKLNKQAEEKNPVQVQFQKFEERMVDYPELIYDGPFSEHIIKGIRPRLEGDKITEAEARKKVQSFLKDEKIGKVEKLTNGRGRIDTYSFEIVPETQKEGKGNPTYIDISQRKGYIVWVLNNREIDKKNISSKQAVQHANKFLEAQGFKDMVTTYTMTTYGGSVLINYVYKQDNVLMYPDLIKVKVALDNGEIVGFDSTHFLTSNYKRDIQPPKLTPEQAREKVSMRAKILGEPKLAYIPTDARGEIFCYEFKADYKGDTFFIYINVDTGEEEKILKYVESENGTLTM
ncbi:germination protein YpeB [Anaerosolibacter sp.]|uniref:germination protein YpeB n=1 Tax=Anaerosolibacter sp. TaxID=1872527 RepID=UPI0039EE10D4